jgi:DNA-binding CsgD family transcriptional regulator
VHRGVYGGASTRARSSLVGRSAELQQLRALYGRACQEAGGLGLIWGEAGVGKTRLLDEFGILATEAGARVATASCSEYSCPPFTPLYEVFAALGLANPFEGAPSASLPASAEETKYRSFIAAAEALRTSGRTAPIIASLDDLQWADFASLEFLAFLARRLSNARVLVLASVRSDNLERDHVRLEAVEKLRRDGAATVMVAPLPDDEMRRLVVNLWPRNVAADAAAIERVCALAEGKPYFAEELVHGAVLEESGLIVDSAPLSIRAGVLTRFEQLSEDAQRILLYASVIGRAFRAELLAQSTNRSIVQVGEVLAHARRVQLIEEIRDAPGQFAFRHAITREILYRELMMAQAQMIHAQIAEYLERDEGDAAQRAYHWNAAGNRERASVAFEFSGDLAAARNAYRDAEVAYRHAIDACSGDSRKRYGSLCEKFSRALSINGELGDACAWGKRAVESYVRDGEYASAIALALFVARRYGDAGRQEEGVAIAQMVMALLKEHDNPELRYGAHVTIALLEAQQGHHDDALAELVLAESVAGEHALEERQLFYGVRADLRATAGQLVMAIEDSLEAVRLARRIGNAERLSITLSNYARFAFFGGRTDAAMAAYCEAIDLVEREHLGRAAAIVTRALAFVNLLTGDLEAARHALELSLEISGGVVAETAAASLGLRLAYLRDEDERAAGYATVDLIERAFASGQTDSIGPLAGSVAAYYDATGKRDRATALRSRALSQIRGVNVALWLLDQLATSSDAGEVVRARALLDHAARDPDHAVARAHLALFDARAAREAGNVRAAKVLACDAAERFQKIGWRWEEAQALEIAGRSAEALKVYEKHGYLRHARRLTEARRRARHRAGADKLTPRESEVVRLAVDGKSNREIAELLSIGERTVETHIAAVFDRFDLTSRRQLAGLVDARGLP